MEITNSGEQLRQRQALNATLFITNKALYDVMAMFPKSEIFSNLEYPILLPPALKPSKDYRYIL